MTVNSSSPLRVGVAGLGKMGLLHAAVLNALSGSRVVAAADPSPLARRVLAEMNSSVRVYAAAGQMLDSSDLDAVVIATPVADHVPVAMECVRRGIPFLMEKPLATSATDALELVTGLRQARVPHIIGYMTRYVEAFRMGQELVSERCLGRLQRVAATIYVSQLFRRGSGWRYDRKVSGGGVLLSQGSHVLDLLTWYFGPVARVNADVLSVYSAEVEDFAHVMLEFQCGLRGWIDSSWSVRFRRTVETTIEVLGDNGLLVLTDDSVRLFLDEAAGRRAAGWTVWNAVNLYRGVEVDVGGPQYTREDQAFLEAVRTGAMPHPGIREAFHVQQIIDAAYSSSRRESAPETITHE